MKAVICDKYGSVADMKVVEIEKPVPKNNEVCIKIVCSAVTESDLIMRGELLQLPLIYQIPMRIMFGILKPRNPILGFVFSGEIIEVGKDVRKFKQGDNVLGLTGFSKGAYAEYKCMKATNSLSGCIAIKPEKLSHEQSTVAVYGGLLAYQFLGKRKIREGDKVLIYGASGTCGTMAVQIANYFGANVSAICSGKNREMVENLGAAKVYDYKKEDHIDNDVKFDFILDAVGRRKSSALKNNIRNNLKSNGSYISIDDELLKMDSANLESLCKILKEKSMKYIIDKTYNLNQIQDAHNYVQKRGKVGGVVIKIV